VIVRELITLLGFKVDDTGQKDYNKSIDETKGKQQSLTASILKANLIGKAAGAVLGAAFSFIKDSVIGTTAEIERYRVALGTMIGDQEKANEIIHNLDYSDVSDFYGTAAAIGGLKSMVTLGMEAQNASDILTKLGDVAQGDGAAFQSLSQNMGQVFAKGKADAMDLKQFVAQGFDVSGEVAALDMAKQMGVNVTAIDRQSAAFQAQRKAVEKAGISYAQTEAALISVTSAGGKYEGMLEKQSNTLGGIINKFKSLTAATAEAIGTGLSEDLKGLLKYFLEVGKAGQEQFAGVFVKAIKAVIDFIWRVIVHAQTLRYRIEDIGLGFEPIIGLVRAFGEMFQETLIGLFPFIEQVAIYLMTWWNVLADFLTPIIQQLGPLFRKVFEFLADAVSGAIPIVESLSVPLSIIGAVLGVIIKGLGGMIDFLKPIAPLIGAIAAIIGVWTAAQWLLNIAMMANPIGLIVAAVIAAVALIVGLVMVVKENWGAISQFFIDLWEGIKKALFTALDAIKAAFFAVVDFIKGIWKGIVSFFSGIWEALMQGPQVAIEYIRTAFTKLFDGIKEKLFGFINKVKEGWDKVTGFFGKAVTGVVNFFTGGEDDLKARAPTKVNDMILTPEGQFQTSPDDYIMAMKDPRSLIDAVLRFLGQGLGSMPEPALAGATGQGMVDSAMFQAAAAPTNYNTSTSSYSESFQAPITVNVNAAGMNPQEAQQAVQRGVEDALKNAINSSRGNIPRPEVERF
jgi:phage-related protein